VDQLPGISKYRQIVANKIITSLLHKGNLLILKDLQQLKCFKFARKEICRKKGNFKVLGSVRGNYFPHSGNTNY
jgi:hypothetical protein